MYPEKLLLKRNFKVSLLLKGVLIEKYPRRDSNTD